MKSAPMNSPGSKSCGAAPVDSTRHDPTRHDPTRRNRNIGTAKQGHGRTGQFSIPETWRDDRIFYERLRNPVVVHREIYGKALPFLVEPPRQDSYHPCSVDDVVRVLEILPSEAIAGVDTFVLRQPTRKEEVLSPVWGRLCYAAELGKYSGVTIFLEAQRRRAQWRWSVSQSPSGLAEIESLRAEGHRIHRAKRHFEITSSPEAARATQLFRTVPHEVGHLVHFEQAVAEGIDHWGRSVAEKEHFAEAYAAEFRQVAGTRIPFAPQFNKHEMHSEGQRLDWFFGS